MKRPDHYGQTRSNGCVGVHGEGMDKAASESVDLTQNGTHSIVSTSRNHTAHRVVGECRTGLVLSRGSHDASGKQYGKMQGAQVTVWDELGSNSVVGRPCDLGTLMAPLHRVVVWVHETAVMHTEQGAWGLVAHPQVLGPSPTQHHSPGESTLSVVPSGDCAGNKNSERLLLRESL